MLETNLFLPVVHVVSCFYNDFLACGGRSVSMIFAAKNAKIAKVLGVGFAPSVCTLSARSRISDRLQAQLYGMISLLPGIELRGDGGTNGSL